MERAPDDAAADERGAAQALVVAFSAPERAVHGDDVDLVHRRGLCTARRRRILVAPARPAPNPAPTLTPSASMGQRGTRFPGTIVRPSPAGLRA
jgi:hypothetical protein